MPYNFNSFASQTRTNKNVLASDLRRIASHMQKMPRLRMIFLGETHGQDNPMDPLGKYLLDDLPGNFITHIVLEQWRNLAPLAKRFNNSEIGLSEFASKYNFPTDFFQAKFTPVRYKTPAFFRFLEAARDKGIPIQFIDVPRIRCDKYYEAARRDQVMFSAVKEILDENVNSRVLFHGGYGHGYKRQIGAKHSICPSLAELVEQYIGPKSTFSSCEVVRRRDGCQNVGQNTASFNYLDCNRFMLVQDVLTPHQMQQPYFAIYRSDDGSRQGCQLHFQSGSRIHFSDYDAVFYAHDWCRRELSSPEERIEGALAASKTISSNRA